MMPGQSGAISSADIEAVIRIESIDLMGQFVDGLAIFCALRKPQSAMMLEFLNLMSEEQFVHPDEQLIRIEGPDFVAGLVLRDGVCIRAAPVIGWCVGQSADALKIAFANKLWRARRVE